VIEPKFSSDFPKSLSAHDIGLKNLIESASLFGELPKMYLVIISIKNFQNLALELSPQITQFIHRAITEIKKLLNKMVEKD
jgi:hydrogenase maturation protease